MPEPCRIGLKPFLARITAPPEADRAELRFRKPGGGHLVIDDVSFQAASQATANGDFRVKAPAIDPVTNQIVEYPNGKPVYLPQGWHVAAGNTPLNQVIAFDDAGILYLIAMLYPAELSQSLTVMAGKPFTVEFQAYPYPAGKFASAGRGQVGIALDRQQGDGTEIRDRATAVRSDAAGWRRPRRRDGGRVGFCTAAGWVPGDRLGRAEPNRAGGGAADLPLRSAR